MLGVYQPIALSTAPKLCTVAAARFAVGCWRRVPYAIYPRDSQYSTVCSHPLRTAHSSVFAMHKLSGSADFHRGPISEERMLSGFALASIATPVKPVTTAVATRPHAVSIVS